MGCVRLVIVAVLGATCCKETLLLETHIPGCSLGSAPSHPPVPDLSHAPCTLWYPARQEDVQCWVGCTASGPRMQLPNGGVSSKPSPIPGGGGYAPIRITHQLQLSHSCNIALCLSLYIYNIAITYIINTCWTLQWWL